MHLMAYPPSAMSQASRTDGYDFGSIDGDLKSVLAQSDKEPVVLCLQ